MAGFIQGNSADAGTVSSTTLAYNGAVTAGSTLVVVARYGGAADNLTSISDSVNGAWSQFPVRQVDSNIGVLYMAFFVNTTTGTPTVTINFSAAASLRWSVLEYGPCATTNVLDVSNAVNIDVGTGSPATAQITTTNANDILVSGLATNVGSGTVSEGAGFTQRFSVATSKLVVSDQTVAATGTYNDAYTDTLVTETYISGIISLKVAGGAAAKPFPPFQLGVG